MSGSVISDVVLVLSSGERIAVHGRRALMLTRLARQASVDGQPAGKCAITWGAADIRYEFSEFGRDALARGEPDRR